jgi:hypothetical protein
VSQSLLWEKLRLIHRDSVRCALVLAAWCALGGARRCADAAQETWDLDNTTSINGYTTTKTGSPTVVATPFGDGLRFDGNDGLIVNASPISGAANFTIEMLLRPNVNASPTLDQPRILHVQSSAPIDHRALLEGRIQGNQWYLDGFLRAPAASNPTTIASLALIDSTKLHPADRWYAYALVYDGAQLRVYLNGALELSGPIATNPLAAGVTSIGMRANQVNFFSGDIAQVRFTTSALAPADLLSSRIPGDYDGSYYDPAGGVDAADLAVWKNQYGTVGSLPATGNNADGDGNGQVDGGDFLVWQRRLGSQPPNWAAVPEPGAATLGLMIAASLCVVRSTRR